MNIIKKIEEEVEKRCKSPNNIYGYGAWTYHIKIVVKNSMQLAEKYGADKEIVEIAALLHDIASITKKEYIEKHHIYGAEIAEKILNKFNYSKEKTEQVKKCILNHRGSVVKEKTTNEEICIADADAMSHFDNIPSLFSLVYKEYKMSIDEGEKFVKDKLKRSYNKLSKKGKKLYKKKYENSMKIFS